MDKYEYKQRAQEIKSLIESKEYSEAMLIADTIDWSRVKSVVMLTTVSDLYKINKQYEKSRDVLLLAYERYPEGRTIVYSLCELSLKLDDFLQAVEYYKEFVRIAPEDTGRYILRYKIYEAQNVSLEERIRVLEEFKSHERREKWCYELAFLYHKAGSISKCVEECDEIVLWFGNGKYVTKALELKMLHETLTPAQEDKYRNRDRIRQVMQHHEDDFAGVAQRVQDTSDEVGGDTKTIPYQDVNIQVKTYDATNKFNTIDIQQEIAKSMKDILADENAGAKPETGFLPQEDDNQPTFDTIERQVISEFMESEKLPEVKPDSDMQEIRFPAGEQEHEDEEEPRHSAIVSNEEDVMEEANKAIQEAIDQSRCQQDEVPKQLADKLSQEYDGQITMVIPDNDIVEKQITGQLNFDDILAEWEKVKQDLEAKRAEKLSQRLKKEAYCVISEFDALNSHTTLQEMEAVADAEIAREAERRRQEGLGEEEITAEEPEEIHGGIVTNVEFEQAEPLENVGEAEKETLDGGAEPAEKQIRMEDADVEVPDMEESDSEESDMEESDIGEELPPVEEIAEIEDDEPSGDAAEEESEAVEEDMEESEPACEDTEEPETVEEDMEESEPACEDEEEPETDEEDASEEGENSGHSFATRELTEDEQILFGEAINTPKMKKQLASAIDKITLASYTGNVIITGNPGTGTLSIAKKLIKSVQQSDSNFSGKVAKVSGESLNRNGVAPMFDRVRNGAVIVEGAGSLTADSLKQMVRYLDAEGVGLIVVLEDTKKAIRRLIVTNNRLNDLFNIVINVDTMDDRALVNYAKKYAYKQEYSVDHVGELELAARIANLQTASHRATLAEVREIVDRAIDHANRKNLRHFFDVIAGKRYDEEDMIILSERDFR